MVIALIAAILTALVAIGLYVSELYGHYLTREELARQVVANKNLMKRLRRRH